jgi:hypothetical protein
MFENFLIRGFFRMSGFRYYFGYVFTSIALTSAFLACSREENKPNERIQLEPSDPSLVGLWQSPCEERGLNSESTEFTFETNEFTSIFRSFSAPKCDQSKLSFVFKLKGVFSTKENRIDLFLVEGSVTPMSDFSALAYNASCQGSGIQKGIATDMRSCKNFESLLKPIFDIYKIEGNQLFTGKNTDDLDGSTPEKRPTEYDTDFMTRQ